MAIIRKASVVRTAHSLTCWYVSSGYGLGLGVIYLSACSSNFPSARYLVPARALELKRSKEAVERSERSEWLVQESKVVFVPVVVK